jgi:FtsP/CotA-like multicopper oxidase with cupredoxin domain
MLTRRQVIKSSLVGAAACLYPSERARLRASQSFWDNPRSPATRPFITPLPIPGVLDARRPGGVRHPSESAPFASPDPECAPFILDPDDARYFRVVAEERTVLLHPDLGPTTVWGYRPENVPVENWPMMLGPTFKVRLTGALGEGVVVRFRNALPSEPRRFGVPRLSTHFHGGHHPARFDGFPTDLDGLPPFVFGVGEEFDYCLPLLDVGSISVTAEPHERGSTLWYHDHFLDFTGPNVYRGLAGMFLCFDELDPGNETDHDPGLGLPSDEFDIPLVLQDRIFAADGSMMYDPLDHDGFLGDKMMVNGAIQPYLSVKRRKYRFRFLNASNARFYQIAIADADSRAYPFDMIATEGGLLTRTLRGMQKFLLGNAERVEIVFDFSTFEEGDVLYLENRALQDDGRGPDEFVSRGTRLMKFVVGEHADDPSRVPDILRPCEPIPPARLANARVRTFEFGRRHGSWVINDELAGHLSRPLARPATNRDEIWRLVNGSGGWWHPVHIHSEFGRVIRRNGRTPPITERDGIARKDTHVLGPNSSVDVFMCFRDYTGPFTFHCHNMEHEDRAMMARFDVM